MSKEQAASRELVEQCRLRSIALLRNNLSPDGILAATPRARAQARGYGAIFGRDAAMCAMGMVLSGDPELAEGALRGLRTLARHQAANGQIPKFVDVERQEADFWYLGCIDATLWWLAAVAFLDCLMPDLNLRVGYESEIARAIAWLQAQEHQRFFLLQQNEASDWADIMPRSGYVLYTNALWYWVKRLYRLPHADETHANANQLFRPFDTKLSDYRRARLLVHYVKRRARNRGLYLSFVNFASFGDEGDVFGNLLAILCGLAEPALGARILRQLERAGVADPYPVKTVCQPITAGDALWRPYMARHQQNFAWKYHNGGIWPFIGAVWVLALLDVGQLQRAELALGRVALANARGAWQFNEWLHGQTHELAGMPHQSWNAGTFLLAHHALCSGMRPFALSRRMG